MTFVAIVGHVDNGKSSLLSKILFPNGTGDTKELDFLPEEAERGITQEYTTHSFEDITFVDTAGHHSFIRSNIKAYTSLPIDLALIICSLRRGEFKAGFEVRGEVTIPPLKEQLLLLRSSGTKRAIIVLTKADLHPSILETDKAIVGPISTFLKNIQMKSIGTIRCSAKSGSGIQDILGVIRLFRPPAPVAPCVPIAMDEFTCKFRILFIPKNRVITVGSIFIAHSNGEEAECILEKVKSPGGPVLKIYEEYVATFSLSRKLSIRDKVILRAPEATIGFCKLS